MPGLGRRERLLAGRARHRLAVDVDHRAVERFAGVGGHGLRGDLHGACPAGRARSTKPLTDHERARRDAVRGGRALELGERLVDPRARPGCRRASTRPGTARTGC